MVHERSQGNDGSGAHRDRNAVLGRGDDPGAAAFVVAAGVPIAPLSGRKVDGPVGNALVEHGSDEEFAAKKVFVSGGVDRGGIIRKFERERAHQGHTGPARLPGIRINVRQQTVAEGQIVTGSLFGRRPKCVWLRDARLVRARDRTENGELHPTLIQTGVGAELIVLIVAGEKTSGVARPPREAREPGVEHFRGMRAQRRIIAGDVACPDGGLVPLQAGRTAAGEDKGALIGMHGELDPFIAASAQQGELVVDIGAVAAAISRLRGFPFGFGQIQPPTGGARLVEFPRLGPEPRVESGMREIEQLAAIIAAFDRMAVPVRGEHPGLPARREGRRIAPDHRTGLRHDNPDAAAGIIGYLVGGGISGAKPARGPDVVIDDVRPVGVDYHHVDGKTVLGQLLIRFVDFRPVAKRAFALPVTQGPQRRQRGTPGEPGIALDNLGEPRSIDDIKVDLAAGAVATDLVGNGLRQIETEFVNIVVENAVGMPAAPGAQQQRNRILGSDVAGLDFLAGPKIADRAAPVEASGILIVLAQTQELLVAVESMGERPGAVGLGDHAGTGENRRAVAFSPHFESKGGAIDADRERRRAQGHGARFLEEGKRNARDGGFGHREGCWAQKIASRLEPDANDVIVECLDPHPRGSRSGDNDRR